MKGGQEFSWEYRKENEQNFTGQPTSKSASSTRLNFKVISATKNNYIIELSFGETTILDENQAKALKESPLAWVSEYAKALRIRISLDKNGQFEGIVNFDELRKKNAEVMPKLFASLKSMKAPGYGTQASARLEKQLLSLYDTREGLESIFSTPLGLIIFAMGQTWDTQTPFEYTTTLPNFLGGDPLEADGVVSVKSFNKKKNSAVLVNTMKISKESFSKMIGDSAKQFGNGKTNSEKASAAEETVAVAKGVDILDETTYMIDLKSGLTMRAKFVRRAIVPGGYRLMSEGIDRI